MTERWRKVLGRIDGTGPDEGRLASLASGGPRHGEGPPARPSRFVAAVVSLAVASGAIVLAWNAFDTGGGSVATSPSSSSSPFDSPSETPSPSPPATDRGPWIDPGEVCDVPAYDPNVSLLVGTESAQYPKEVLDGPGASASELEGPAADALRAYLASPRARNAPSEGWREIRGEDASVEFGAPMDEPNWWVVGFTLTEGDAWKVDREEIVSREQTPAQRGRHLILEWTGEVVLENGTWTSTLRLVNEGSTEWREEYRGYRAIGHVLGGGEDRAISWAGYEFRDEPYAIPPGGSREVPLAIGGVATSLPSGRYDVVACIPDLALASEPGSLRVVDGPAEVPNARVLTYETNGTTMDALGIGTLVVHEGCLAIANPAGRPNYIVLPEGFALVRQNRAEVLIDPIGQRVAALGDEAQFAGGHVPGDLIGDAVIGGLPESCRSNDYFLSGGPA